MPPTHKMTDFALGFIAPEMREISPVCGIFGQSFTFIEQVTFSLYLIAGWKPVCPKCADECCLSIVSVVLIANAAMIAFRRLHAREQSDGQRLNN